jgi:two-component system, OmpR family, KDP operon response regulator KdpE
MRMDREASKANKLSNGDCASAERGLSAPMLKSPAARILVIDDQPAVVDTLVACLRGEGYGVFGAETSDEGLKLAILARPELVLLDIALPDMDGIALLKRIRSIMPTTRVIMVSGNTDPVLAREALELGALAYVDKPFDFAYLKRVIAMALGEGL